MTRNLQYFVVYYFPGIVGSARINLGVVLVTPDEKMSHVRFIDDWERVKSLEPDTDIELFRAICSDIEERIKHGGAKEMIRVMEDTFSNVIQVSDRMEYEADDPVRAMNDLASKYLH
ncbi:MAG: DUF3037 domain-containing protein [Candidatus Sulfotelmatobacter sp.]